MNLARVQIVCRTLTSMARCQFSSKPMVTLTDDGTTIVCWHPREDFPYEHTRPYEEHNEMLASESVLKVDSIVAGRNRFYSDGPTLEELQTITYTPKHKWKYNRNDGIQWRPAHPRKGV